MTEENESKNYRATLIEMLGERPHAYYPILIKALGGVIPGIMASQLLYWNGDKYVQKRNGWILKSVKELEDETGLTKFEQQTARRFLVENGVIEAALKGMPRIWHYKINFDQLIWIISDPSHWTEKPTGGITAQFSSEKQPSIERRRRPMLDGDAAQYSTATPLNIERERRSILSGDAAQLNNVLKTTSLKTTSLKTTSSSYEMNDEILGEEEEAKEKLTPLVISELNRIGVFKKLHAEIARAGYSESALLEMIKAAEKQEREPGKAAALFMYRLRNTPAGAERVIDLEERERRARAGYISGEFSEFINH